MDRLKGLTGGLLVMILILAGCDAYNTSSGQAPDGTGVTKPGGFPGSTNNAQSRQAPVPNSPDTVTKLNDQPQTPSPHEFTPNPNSLLSVTPVPGATQPVSEWQVYTDSKYQYSIRYPSRYEVKLLGSNELGKLRVPAIAGVDFNDPTVTLAGMVFSGFTIRVYQFDANSTVEKWLEAHGLYQTDAGWTIEPYQGKHFSGYQVNSAQYISPGMFIYTVKAGYIFQLTPVSGEANTMLTTFEFNP